MVSNKNKNKTPKKLQNKNTKNKNMNKNMNKNKNKNNNKNENENMNKNENINKNKKTIKRSRKVVQSPHSTIIIGKIYSNGCIHCIHLKPIWDEMEKELSKQHSHFMFKKIEQTNEELETAEINNTYLQNAPNKLELQGGYPTIFKIVNGKVFYYNGDRSVPGLMEWSMKKGQ